MQRAALYARVSSERQAQEHTIQSQLAALRRYAERQGFYTNAALTYSDRPSKASQSLQMTPLL